MKAGSTGLVRRGGTVRRAIFGLLALLAVGVPPNQMAAWLQGAYTATDADLLLGVWLWKGALLVLAITAVVIEGLPVPDVAESPRPHVRPATLGVMAGVTLVAIVLRVTHLGTELWLDEILTRVRYVPLEFRQLLSTYDSQNHQPLYSVMARASWLLLGGADWTIRVPAVLFGVGSVIAAWRFGRRVASEPEAVLAALLLAVSYHHVWFSQNARGYTVMLCLCISATGVFQRLCAGTSRPVRLVWAYGLLMSLATYTHLTAALIAVGHAVALLVTTRWTAPHPVRRVLGPLAALAMSGLLTITFYALMLPQVVRQISMPTMRGAEVEWTGAGWLVAESLRVLAQGIPGGLVTVMAGVGVVGVGIVSYWRQSRQTTLLMFLPPVLTLVAVLAARHNLWPRFFFFAAAFVVLVTLRGGFVLVRWLVKWRPTRVATVGATAVAALSALTVPRAWQPKQRFQEAYEFVEARREPGDQVVGLDIAGHLYLFRGQGSSWGFTTSVAMLSDAERSAKRTWVVYTLPTRLRAVAPELYAHLAPPRYNVVRVFPATVGGAEIYVLRRDSTSGS